MSIATFSPEPKGKIQSDRRSEDVSQFAERRRRCAEAITSAFERNFADGLEDGAALCVWLDDDLIIDLHRGLPAGRDTLLPIFSASKGAVALTIAHFVDRE